MKHAVSFFTVLAAFALPIAGTDTAHAQGNDYTIIVPVAVSDMPVELREIEINCTVSGAPAPGRSRETLGGGSVRRPLTGGGFTGDVTVAFNRTALAGSRVPTHWACSMRAYGTISGSPAEFWTYEDPTTRQTGLKSPPDRTPRLEIPAAPGAAKVVQVGGTLPSATAATPAPGKPQQPPKPDPNKPKPQ